MTISYEFENTAICNGLDTDALSKAFRNRKKKLEQMPSEEAEKEVRRVMIKAGIIDNDGNLMPPYNE